MQLLLLIKKILTISLVPSLLFADTIGDIVEQTGKGALTRNNEEFVAVVDQLSITLLDCMLIAVDLLFELIDCGLKVLELFVVRPFHLLELVLKP